MELDIQLMETLGSSISRLQRICSHYRGFGEAVGSTLLGRALDSILCLLAAQQAKQRKRSRGLALVECLPQVRHYSHGVSCRGTKMTRIEFVFARRSLSRGKHGTRD